MGLAYRASQFFRALRARPDPEIMALAERHLPLDLRELFREQGPPDMAHSLRVYRTLLSRGASHPDLLSAALLHDVGKTLHRLSLLERVLVVLGKGLVPARAARWGEGSPVGWRRPFVVAAQHPEWGAEMVRRRGGTSLLANIIRRHQLHIPGDAASEEDRLIRCLQAADGRD
jgi:putative nucleotidyltransferase with HDIG domain